MIRNIITIFIIIISIVLILILLDRIIKNKELFNVVKIRGNILDNPDIVAQFNKIFVGISDNHITSYDATQLNDIQVGTNNTIFIKDGVKLPGDKFLGINELKHMKYLPYNFKDKLCIGNACINKSHLQLLKGKIPFRLLTFPRGGSLDSGPSCLTLQEPGGNIPGNKSIYQPLSCDSPNTDFENGNLFYFKRDAQPTSTGPVFHEHAAEEVPHDTH